MPARAFRSSRVCARWLALAVVLIGMAAAPRAAAWNARGHMLVALIAYDALPEARRRVLLRLLEAHPRFREDLLAAVPAGLEGAGRDRWLFAYAATWPDLARGQPAYEHGTWHYVNLPLELRRGRLASCREARRDYPESVRRLARLDAERRAAGQPGIPSGDPLPVALGNNLRVLDDAARGAGERALALTWLLHLVGDAHQPLHTVALFTPGAFASGDRGGNDILARGRGSLHRVWDELLGEDTSPAALDAGAGALRGARLPASLEQAARALDVERWLLEGCEIARSRVYVPQVLAKVERDERGAHGGAAPGARGHERRKPEVSLGRPYFERATHTAEARALLAGLRLAALLTRGAD